MFNNKIIILSFIPQLFLVGSVFAENLFEDEDVIWEKGTNVYIKYTEQDTSVFGENDHPVVLEAEQISRALDFLTFLDDDHSDSKREQESVFTEVQIDVLSQNFAKALANAKPDQDIIFALDKRSKKFFGLKANRLFVAGRAFYKDEKLNIVIGDYNRGADEGFEAAYDPTHVGIVRYHFDHGRRMNSSKGFAKPVAAVQGIENKQLEGNHRNDWFVIDVKSILEGLDAKARLQKSEEQARKREEIMEILGSEEVSPSHPAVAAPGAPASSAAPPAGAASAAPAGAANSIEERLSALNRLKDKGLITDEEYASKRKQILDEL